jgi:hypothetical protein
MGAVELDIGMVRHRQMSRTFVHERPVAAGRFLYVYHSINFPTLRQEESTRFLFFYLFKIILCLCRGVMGIGST